LASNKESTKKSFHLSRILAYRVEGLGTLYKINGWVFWLGIGCFQIGQNSIENYSELLGIFSQKRPDLFKKYGRSK
jgi:hypothetical protein